MPVLVDTPIWSLALRRDQQKLNPFERALVAAVALSESPQLRSIFIICAVCKRRDWQAFTSDGDFKHYQRALSLSFHEVRPQ